MAGQRKAWDSLSPEYRERLSRAGITPAMHEAGESIRAARGHAHTPEHPVEGIADAARFKEWFATRQALVRRVARRKERLFGSSHKWNGRKNYDYVRLGYDGKHPPSNALLRWALNASDDEIMSALESRDEDYSFLFYH